MALGCGPAKTGHGLHPHLPSQFDSLRWARVIGRPVLTWLLLLFFPFRNRFRNKVSPRYRRPIRVSRSSLFHTQPPRPWPSSCPTCRPSEKRATYLFFFSFTAEKGTQTTGQTSGIRRRPDRFHRGQDRSWCQCVWGFFYDTTTSSASFSTCLHPAHIFVERLVPFFVVDGCAYSRSGFFLFGESS